MKFFLREQRKVPEHIEELILRGNGYSDQCFFSKQYYVLVLPDFTCPPRQTILQIIRRQKNDDKSTWINLLQLRMGRVNMKGIITYVIVN